MELRKYTATGKLGVYAQRRYNRLQIVHILSGETLDKPSPTSIHVGSNKHIVDDVGKYINHSFEPNVVIIGKNIVAIRDIFPGEEITFNYNHSEINMAAPFYDNDVLVCGRKVPDHLL